MVLYGAIPESKRFFKISELAGKRWPSVTDDQIYGWHDEGYKVPVAAEGFPPIVDTTVSNRWNDPPHCGEINLISYWVFFPEFHTLPSTPPETILEVFKENIFVDVKLTDRLEKLMDESPELFNFELVSNSFFMIESDCSNGFAFNNRGFIDCWEFYNEQGMLCPYRCFDATAKRWVTSKVIIKKEDLLIKASSVKFLEQIAPEITSANHETIVSTRDGDKADYQLSPGEKILSGWKEVAEHTGYALDTVKKKFKNAVARDKETGRIITTTQKIDSYRLSKATPKK